MWDPPTSLCPQRQLQREREHCLRQQLCTCYCKCTCWTPLVGHCSHEAHANLPMKLLELCLPNKIFSHTGQLKALVHDLLLYLLSFWLLIPDFPQALLPALHGGPRLLALLCCLPDLLQLHLRGLPNLLNAAVVSCA